MYYAQAKRLSDLLRQVEHEYECAISNHPMPNPNLRQLVEKVGDVAKSLRNIENGTESHADLVNECAQVAAMALRVAIQGES